METAKLQLTASDLAAITKVNEGRASVGLPPLPGADGQLTLPAFKAKYANIIAAAATAESGTDPNAEPAPTQEPTFGEQPRLDAVRGFTLYRHEDETGVSGTGTVAEGCLFHDGRVAMRWRTATASTTLFDNMDQVLKVHGHDGKTEVIWDDEKLDP